PYGNDLRDNLCHHIAIVKTGNLIWYYVDGNSIIGYGTYPLTISSTHSTWIGSDEPAKPLSQFKGIIHEVRLWNIARTYSEIQGYRNFFLSGNEAGLVGYWRMNYNSGQLFNDFTPGNNDGYRGSSAGSDAADPGYVAGCGCSQPAATITPNGPTTFCYPGTVVLSANTGTGYIYQWRKNTFNISGATLQNYTANATGSYDVVVTSNGCSALAFPVAVTVNPLPGQGIGVGGPTSFCPGGSVTLTSGNTGTGNTYQWRLNGIDIAGATSVSYSASASGSYSCVTTNLCATTASVPITVSNNTGLAASITPPGNVSFCSTGSTNLTATAGTGYSYQWKKSGINISGATSQVYNVNQAGSYSVTITSSNCTGTSSLVNVIADQPLSPTITPAGTWFCASSPVPLDVQPMGFNFTYQWFEDSHELTNSNNYELVCGHNGNYSCTVTNACGTYPSSSYMLFDQLLDMQPNAYITANGPLSICNGASTTLSVDSWYYSNYQWLRNSIYIPGATTASYSPTQAGSYACRLDFCGTMFSNWLTVTTGTGTLPTASISAGGPLTFCAPGNVMLQAVTGSWSYEWYKDGIALPGNISSSYNAFSSGSYTCRTGNSCGYVSSNAIVVAVNPLPVVSVSAGGAPTSFCAGGSVTLSVYAGTGNTYQWKKNSVNIPGATATTYIATTSGTYTYSATNNCGTSTASNAYISVTDIPAPIITPAGSTAFCPGGSVTLNANNISG
ncbi:MAG: LamG-like jellyroll fold domain-containing protein, partial [Bacteroidota bacterium]